MINNIIDYSLDHEYFNINNLPDKCGKVKHFNSSIDIGYFIDAGYKTKKAIDDVVIKMVKNIVKKEIIVTEKNRKYTNKDGVTKQYMKDRIIRFDRIMMVYHNRHRDNSKIVNPHLHIFFLPNARMGIGYMYLKKALEEEALKYDLKFNFMNSKRKNGLTKENNSKLKNMSWILSHGDEDKVVLLLKSPDTLKYNLKLLDTHFLYTKNISYFLKILQLLNQRLVEYNLDFFYNNVNMRDEIYFRLTSEQVYKINKLKKFESVDLNLDDILDREILKFAYGFRTEASKILVNKFKIDYIDPSQLHISKEVKKQITNKPNFINLVKKDIRNAFATSIDDKYFIQTMMKMEYKNISIKNDDNLDIKKTENSKQKKDIELITKKGMKLSFSYEEIRLTWIRKQKIFAFNARRILLKVELNSAIEFYQQGSPNNETEYQDFTYKMQAKLVLHYSKDVDTKDVINAEFNKYKITRSEMYNITTYEEKQDGFLLVDYGDHLVLKESNSIEKGINAVMDIIQKKYIDIPSITLSGNEIICAMLEQRLKSKNKVILHDLIAKNEANPVPSGDM